MGPLFLAADDMAGAWLHEFLLIPFSRKRTDPCDGTKALLPLERPNCGRHAPNAAHEIVRVCSSLS
jgi:hypothetical protein